MSLHSGDFLRNSKTTATKALSCHIAHTTFPKPGEGLKSASIVHIALPTIPKP